MNTPRIINAAIWLYLWLSQALDPVTTDGDFWTAKKHQLFQFTQFNDLGELIGKAIIPFFCWLAIDYFLRKRQKTAIKP